MNTWDEIDFELLLQDEELLKIISDPNIDDKERMRLLAENYSFSRDDLLYAIEFIRHHQSLKQEMNPAEIRQMWGKIGERYTKRAQKGVRRFSMSVWWKAAASVAVLLLCSYFIYTRLTVTDPLKHFADSTPVEKSEHAVIILSDGSEYILDNNHARVEYGADGKEVVIQKSENETEKLTNQQSSRDVILNQAIVPFGRRHRIALSDGTVVELNSGSRLVFPAVFTGKSREVYLQGEAFFEVSKQNGHSFVVNTEHMAVRVLGTSFNVSAYTGENTVSAVLAEGSIDVVKKGRLVGNEKYSLKPGQGYFYSVGTTEGEISEVDLRKYVSWKDGWLFMQDQPVSDIVAKLEKYYNISIQIEEPGLSGALVSGKLVLSENVDKALDYLANTLEVRAIGKSDGIFILTE